MLFPQRFWAGLADGSITLAFRRWRRRAARPGSHHHSPVGVLAIDAVDPVEPEDLTADDARRAGYDSLTELLDELARHGEGTLYRIELHWAGPDPREALRAEADLGDEDVAELTRRLDRYDRASTPGPWTRATLELIHANPGVRAGDLAGEVGRETPPFKADVRKLKALGLTESLRVGYRLSARGEAYRAATHRS